MLEKSEHYDESFELGAGLRLLSICAGCSVSLLQGDLRKNDAIFSNGENNQPVH